MGFLFYFNSSIKLNTQVIIPYEIQSLINDKNFISFAGESKKELVWKHFASRTCVLRINFEMQWNRIFCRRQGGLLIKNWLFANASYNIKISFNVHQNEADAWPEKGKFPWMTKMMRKKSKFLADSPSTLLVLLPPSYYNITIYTFNPWNDHWHDQDIQYQNLNFNVLILQNSGGIFRTPCIVVMCLVNPISICILQLMKLSGLNIFYAWFFFFRWHMLTLHSFVPSMIMWPGERLRFQHSLKIFQWPPLSINVYWMSLMLLLTWRVDQIPFSEFSVIFISVSDIGIVFG